MTKAIVFDLDGTLVNSAPDLHSALNKVLASEGAAPLSLSEATAMVGHGIPHLVSQAMRAREIEGGRLEAMTRAMFAHYLAAPAKLSHPYEGVIEALEGFKAQGYALGLCTNKAMEPTRKVLDGLGLTSYFAAVIGGDSLPKKKPDPAPLHAAFAALEGAEPIAYIGDSEVDAQTAQAMGVPFALFTRGYRKTPADQLPHDFAFDDYARLPAWIASRADEG